MITAWTRRSLSWQISVIAGSAIAALLLLLLPLSGWGLSARVAESANTLVSVSPDVTLKNLQMQQTQRALKEATALSGPFKQFLTDSLLIHPDTVSLNGRELPLLTHRGRPLHLNPDALTPYGGSAGGYAAVWIQYEGVWVSHVSNRSGVDPFMAPGSRIDTAWPQAKPALLALSNDKSFEGLLSTGETRSGNTQAADTQAGGTQAGETQWATVAIPLRNSAGEVAAALVILQPLPALPGAVVDALRQAEHDVDKARTLLRQQGQTLLWASLGLATLLAVLSATLIAWTVRQHGSRFKQLTAVILRLGSGDWSARADTRDDTGNTPTQNEVSLLARAINRMAQQTGQVFINLKTGTHRIAESANALSGAADQLNEGARRESQAATGMAAAVEEMTTSINCVGQNAEETRGVSQRAHALAAESTQAVIAATAKMQTLRGTVEHTSGVIAQLSQQSLQISAIAGMIREIAEQTNLLALNAAIEAARAGENGRGFSVVADEVRRLAERTSDSTDQIKGMIDAIQASADLAVGNMQTAVDEVTDGVHMVEQVGQNIARIHEEASQVANAVDAIHFALREQNTASCSLAQQVDCVAGLSDNNQRASMQSAEAVRDMSATIGQMQALLDKIAAGARGTSP